MDLSSPNGAYGDLDVETVIKFDENNRPYLATVPVPARVPVQVAQRYVPEPTGPAPGQMTVYQPVQPYYGPPSAPTHYSPVHDPIVCRLLAGAVAVVAGAFALSFVLAALAAAETALALLLGILLLIWLMSSGKGGSDKAVNIQITNSNRSRRRN